MFLWQRLCHWIEGLFYSYYIFIMKLLNIKELSFRLLMMTLGTHNILRFMRTSNISYFDTNDWIDEDIIYQCKVNDGLREE